MRTEIDLELKLENLENESPAELNPDQQAIYNYFVPKDGRSAAGFHLLSAEAGYGKTFLVKKIFANLPKGKCYILCPTHKAKSLYKFPYSKNIYIQTIHRFFGSELDYTDDGQQMFKFKVPPVFSPNTNKVSLYTVIVDEASMVSSEMLKIFSQISDVTTILFTCDEAQLPPVNEEISPIFKIKNIVNFSLTKNMRARESISLDQVRHFRRNVFAKIKTPTFSKSFVRDEDFILAEMKKYNDAVIITWTNLRKDYWNAKVRAHLFGAEGSSLKRIYIGEQLIFSGFRKTYSNVYHSSDPVIIQSVQEEKILVNYVPATCNCPPESSPRPNLAIQGCSSCGIDARKTLGLEIDFYIIVDQFNVEWKIPATEQDVRVLKRILSHQKKHILKMKTQVKNINQYWVGYYDRVSEFNSDLSYSYAITAHKSQGSEYNSVFIDYANLSQAREPRGIKERLLYTSASRMMDNLYFTPA